MSERMIVGMEVFHIILESIPSSGYDAVLFEIKILNDDTKQVESKHTLGFTRTFYNGREFLESREEFHSDFPFWILRRYFVQEYKKRRQDTHEPWTMGLPEWQSLIGNTDAPRDDADKELLKLVDIFLREDPERPMAISELFWSGTYNYSNFKKALAKLEHLHKVLTRVGEFSLKLAEGKYAEFQDLKHNLEDRTIATRIPYFHEVPITLPPNFGFILMPFKDSKTFQQTVYTNTIIPYIKEKYDIECFDVRDSKLSNKIDNKLYTCLVKSSFVLADITRSNPNVMYELGMAHILEKPTIIVTKNSHQRLPFDVRGMDIDKYDAPESLKAIIDSRLPSIQSLIFSES